jgi:hypothetical protein
LVSIWFSKNQEADNYKDLPVLADALLISNVSSQKKSARASGAGAGADALKEINPHPLWMASRWPCREVGRQNAGE